MDGSGRGVEFSAARTGRRRIRETGMVRRRRADGTGQGGEARGRRAKRKARSRSIDARRVGRTSHSPRTFHKCSVLSAPAVATVAPSGENSTHVTASSWPSSSMMGASREDVRWCAPGLNFCLNEGCATANAAELPSPVFCFCATRPSSASSVAGAAAALRLPAIARSGVVMTRRGFSDFLERTRDARRWSRCGTENTTRAVAAFARLRFPRPSLEAAHGGCQRATKRTESTRPKERPPGRLSAMASAAGSRYGRRRAPLTAGTLAKPLVTASRHRVSASRPSSPVVSPPDRPPPLSSPPTLPHGRVTTARRRGTTRRRCARSSAT